MNSKETILLYIILIFLLIILYFKYYRIEKFTSIGTNVTVFTTFKYNNINWVIDAGKYNWELTEILPERWSDFNNIQHTTNNTYLICDEYDKINNYPNSEEIMKSPKGYFVGLALPENAFKMSCILNLSNKTVGYFDRCDLHFLNAIIKSHRLQNVTIKQLDSSDINNLITILSSIDIIYTFVIPKNRFYNAIQSQSISIMGFNNLDWNRLNLFYPYTTRESVKISSLFMSAAGSSSMVLANADNTLLPSMQFYVLHLSSKSNISEDFVTQLSINNNRTDPSFRCYGNLDIDNQALCESKYDVIGLPKSKDTYWDKPCLVDTDCPYFKANKQYDNNRGGCKKDGMCEFPIGTTQLSYTKALDTDIYSPFCYNCDPMNTTCCKHIDADLAFENDTEDRKKAGLQLTLPL